ncbi:hypothetical protein JCM16303_001892 [Sporobolomyces ruberrimus]
MKRVTHSRAPPPPDLYPFPVGADEDELDLIPRPCPHRPKSPHHRPAPKQSTKRKSAQSIQTPSASPRHQPAGEQAPVASTSRTLSQPSTKRRRNSSLVFRNDRDTQDSSPRKQGILRRSLGESKTNEANQAVVVDQVREDPPIQRVQKAATKRRRGDAVQQPPKATEPRRSERVLRREEIESENVDEEEEEEEGEEEEDGIKEELLSDEEGSVFVKGEDQDGDEHERFYERERQVQADKDEMARVALSRTRNMTSTRPNHAPTFYVSEPYHDNGTQDWTRSRDSRSIDRDDSVDQSHLHPSAPSPVPSASHSPVPSMTLESLFSTLNPPRLSRLVPHFRKLGFETPEDLWLLLRPTDAGLRLRETMWEQVGEYERVEGREFTMFEREMLKIELEESRQRSLE